MLEFEWDVAYGGRGGGGIGVLGAFAFLEGCVRGLDMDTESSDEEESTRRRAGRDEAFEEKGN